MVRTPWSAAAIFAAFIVSVCSEAIASPQNASRRQTGSLSDVEEVFVYLAVRSNRTPAQDDPACKDAGFTVVNRNDGELMALSVMADGRVNQVGNLLGTNVLCFGARDAAGRTPFYSRISINAITAIGRGECTQQYRDFPEPLVSIQDCWPRGGRELQQ